ncbi:MAG TPA: helix-turn-helix transcriptional regulator [Candidatus Eisenbacteria bacterium]|nr:helix-turn-helix transcriptional regulator [Candidatus Eisenbacteria bacterium]
MPTRSTGRSLAAADRGLALEIGRRIRAERLRAGLTQARLAEGRYTKAYISALENGLAKPSMAALSFIAGRLELPMARFVGEQGHHWSRLEADLLLASAEWSRAADAYLSLRDVVSDPIGRAEIDRGLAEALCRLERPDEALRAAAPAAAAFDAAGQPVDAAWARYWMATAFYQQEHDDEARSIFRGLLGLVRGGLDIDPDFETRLLIALATIDGRSGEPARSLSYLEEARALVDTLDDRRRATFLNSLAISYRERGDMEAAIGLANQAIDRFRAIDGRREVGMLENELALVHLALGSIERARQHAALADELLQALGDERGRAHILETQAQIELAADRPVDALRKAEEAIAVATATGNRKAGISAGLTLARAARHSGDTKLALATLEQASASARLYRRPAQLRDVLVEWADLLAETGNVAEAYELSREALSLGSS